MHNKFIERDNNDLCVIVSQRKAKETVMLQVSRHVVLIRQRWRATRERSPIHTCAEITAKSLFKFPIVNVG